MIRNFCQITSYILLKILKAGILAFENWFELTQMATNIIYKSTNDVQKTE
jgi:hypothetical protein